MAGARSLAGSHAAYRAVFQRAGAVLVEDFEALVETATFFAKAPAPKAEGVAIVAASEESYRKASVFAAAAKIGRPLMIFRELHAARRWIDARKDPAAA